MPSSRSLLRELSARPDPDRTLALLSQLSRVKLPAAQLSEYHELLLFYKAHPRSRQMREFCEQELLRFHGRVRALNKYEYAKLDQSGIVGTRLYYPYDEPMAEWLRGRCGEQIDVDWDAYDARDDDPLGSWLPLLMERTEGDALDSSELSTRALIAAARGTRNSLEWILERFGAVFPDRNLRQELYNPMQIALAMTLTPPGPSRTLWDDGEPNKLFLWDPEAARPTKSRSRPKGSDAKFDLVREIKRPIRIPAPVSPQRGRELLDLVMGTLLVRLRELYPCTHGNPAEVYDIPLERGIRIIWFFMTPGMRLPLEAGWGCLILKNNVPIGYGAGGMVAEQSEISINIFDTFRGGEAAWLYAQYARICYHWCRAPWLVTRKWQLGGEGNYEGIESGSYWFYDKLGFCSTAAKLRKLADAERRKIVRPQGSRSRLSRTAKKGYRSPVSVLNRLAEADMVMSMHGRPASEYEETPLERAGLAATRVIAQQFGAKRKGLETRVLKTMKDRFGLSFEGWTKDERSRFAQISLIMLAIPGFERWPVAERRKLFALARAKGSLREADYAKRIPENPKFWKAIRRLK